MQMSIFDLDEKEHIPLKEGKKRILLIDGNNLLNRCFYTSERNCISTFFRMILRYRQELEISHFAVAFDKGRGFRSKLYPEYKGTRGESPSGLKEQLQLVQNLLKRLGIEVYCDETFEADDLIASIVHMYQEDDIYILSNDHDLLQLVSDHCNQIIRKGKDDVFFDKSTFQNYYAGLEPHQIVDLKTIMGDSSDNIIGIPGIGEKGALKLVQHFGSVENITIDQLPKELKRYEGAIVRHSSEALELDKRLTTLVKNAPISGNLSDSISYEVMTKICSEQGYRRLLEDIHRRNVIL